MDNLIDNIRAKLAEFEAKIVALRGAERALQDLEPAPAVVPAPARWRR